MSVEVGLFVIVGVAIFIAAIAVGVSTVAQYQAKTALEKANSVKPSVVTNEIKPSGVFYFMLIMGFFLSLLSTFLSLGVSWEVNSMRKKLDAQANLISQLVTPTQATDVVIRAAAPLTLTVAPTTSSILPRSEITSVSDVYMPGR